MMTRLNLLLGSIVAWLFGACTVIIPFSGYAFETGRVDSVRYSPHQFKNEDGNLLVFDNDILDRIFGKHRGAEKGSNNAERPSTDAAAPKVFDGNNSPTVLPNRSLLAGISRNTASRRAAALRLAEKGRMLIQNREYQKAISYLEKALGLDGIPFIHFYLAWAHYHLGNSQGSLNFLEVAESWLHREPEWMDELMALRSAVSAPQAMQQAISKQNVGWTYVEY